MIDVSKRDELIFGRPLEDSDMSGGIARFGSESYCLGNSISVDIAKQLVELNYLDPEDNQNSSPTAEEFINFCSEYPQVKLHGYVVSPKRDDCRVTIEGLVCEKDITPQLIIDFSNFCHFADDFEVNDTLLYSWWD